MFFKKRMFVRQFVLIGALFLQHNDVFCQGAIKAVKPSERSRQQSCQTHTLFRPWRVIQRPAPLPAPCAPTSTIEQQIRSNIT